MMKFFWFIGEQYRWFRILLWMIFAAFVTSWFTPGDRTTWVTWLGVFIGVFVGAWFLWQDFCKDCEKRSLADKQLRREFGMRALGLPSDEDEDRDRELELARRKSDDITQEQAQEFREVAALVCLDLDLLLTGSERNDMTLEKLRDYVKHIHQMKEDLIKNPKVRKDRYDAAGLIFSAMAEGKVHSVPWEGK